MATIFAKNGEPRIMVVESVDPLAVKLGDLYVSVRKPAGGGIGHEVGETLYFMPDTARDDPFEHIRVDGLVDGSKPHRILSPCANRSWARPSDWVAYHSSVDVKLD